MCWWIGVLVKRCIGSVSGRGVLVRCLTISRKSIREV